MMWVFAILIVLTLGGVALVASGVGSPMGEEYGDRPDVPVPADRPLGADDLRRLRFSVTLRGYRMAEVDALLARLAAEAERRDELRDERLDELRDELRDGQPEGDLGKKPAGPADEREPDGSAGRPAVEADGGVASD